MKKYELEYVFIPELIERYKAGEIDLDTLSDEVKLRDIINQESFFLFFDVNQLFVERLTISDNITFIVYTFPPPLTVPEGKYGILVLDNTQPNTHFYILEKSNASFDGKYSWVLGGKHNPDLHSNYGPFKLLPTKDNFIEEIKRMHGLC